VSAIVWGAKVPDICAGTEDLEVHEVDDRTMLRRAPDDWEAVDDVHEQSAARRLEVKKYVQTRLLPTSPPPPGETVNMAYFQWRITEAGRKAREGS